MAVCAISKSIKMVSIPIGFSSSLQRPAFVVHSLGRVKFQSLSGFQVRCNNHIGACDIEREVVSIPIGFSSSLQPIHIDHPPKTETGFNPYRVFKFVATAEES